MPEENMAEPSADNRAHAGALHDRLITLAGTPDDSAQIEAHLTAIALLAATRIAAVAYASITGHHEGAYATVALSNALVMAVDEAQYADDAGPCLDALDGGAPAAVPDIAATVTWPSFREAATRLGLTTSLSIPLFAGSGHSVAALNLYGRDPSAMKTLASAIWAVYDPDTPAAPLAGLDAGARELATGLISAFSVRNMIQQAIGIVVSTSGGPEDAYVVLCRKAVESGNSLTDTAAQLIAQHQRQR
jgi:GAF domain-containing protein